MCAPARRSFRLVVLAIAAVTVAGGCTPVDDGTRAPVTFALPRALGASFLDVPWPSDVLTRRDDEGRIIGLDLRAIPNPTEVAVLEEYLALFQTARGYPASGTMYFHVEGGVDVATLPDPAGSLAVGASLFLMSVDDPSRRWPVEHVSEPEGTLFLPAGTVAVRPLLGAVPSGTVALVVTSDARTQGGVRLGPSDDLRALLSCAPIEDVLVEVDCAPYAAIKDALGRDVEDLALVQVFTVADATDELAALAAQVRAYRPPVEVTAVHSDHTLYTAYTGTVTLQVFQRGAPPFSSFDGTTGGIAPDEDGRFTVERTEDVPFVLTVPKMAMPRGGFPVVIYGHGTGGDLESGLGDGPSWEAHQLARAGAAMLATSEPLHLTRTGFSAGSEEILTFNFLNPVAGRDGWRQSVVEKVQLVSAVANLAVPWTVSGGESVVFDATRVGYFGHSQGGNVGGVLAGVEDRVAGIFLSGAGGGFGPAVAAKTEPFDIPEVLRTLLGLPDDEAIDAFHPVITLLQLWIDPADPLSYGARWQAYDETRPHLVATSGLVDPYTPKATHAGLAGAFGLPVLEPAAEPLLVLDLLDVTAAPTAEARGNLTTTSGRAVTGVLLQYPSDGHFAVFQNPHAQDAYRRFFATLFADDAPVARTLQP